MNYFVLKRYCFDFVCDCKWQKINILDGATCKTVGKYSIFGSRRNENGFDKGGVNESGS